MAKKKSKRAKSQDKVQVGKTYRSTKVSGYTFKVLRMDGAEKHFQIQEKDGTRRTVEVALMNNQLLKSKIVEVKIVMCEKCEVNAAEIRLINGQEQQCLCELCGQENMYDLVMHNNNVRFVNNGVKANSLTELEIQ